MDTIQNLAGKEIGGYKLGNLIGDKSAQDAVHEAKSGETDVVVKTRRVDPGSPESERFAARKRKIAKDRVLQDLNPRGASSYNCWGWFMDLRSKKTWITNPLGLLFLILSACVPSPRFYFPHGSQFMESSLDEIIATNPMAPGVDYTVVTLGLREGISHHVVQIRDREVPHIHNRQDLTVILLRGQGYVMLREKQIDLATGDILFVPRDVVHYFVNTSADPSVLLAVFTPPFDARGTVGMEGRACLCYL